MRDTATGRKLLVLVPYLLAVGLVVGCIGLSGDFGKLGMAVRHEVAALHKGPPERKTVLTWTVEPEQIMAAVKTGVTKSAVPYTGTLTLTNQRDSGNADDPGPTWAVAVGAGNVVCYLSRIWWDSNASLYAYCVPYMDPSAVYYIPEAQAPSFAEGEIGYIYGLADGNETTGPSGTWPSPVITKLASGVSSIAVNYSLAFGCKRLYRTRTSTPSAGRDASPVYAKETTVSDAWQDVDHPWTYNVSLGTISWTGTQAWTELVPDEYGWWPYLSAPGGIQMMFCQRQGLEGKDYAEVSAKVNGVGLDFTGGTKTYEEFTLTGDGDAVSLGCDSNGDIANQATWNVTALDPLMVDFSGVSVKDRDGNSVNVRLSGGFKADPRYPETLNWSTPAASAGDTVYPTVAELAGLGNWVGYSITGLDFPAGYQHQLLSSGSLSLSITEASAKAAGHAIEDLSIEIQAPPVSATDCKSTFTFAGLDLSHRNNVGLYGPHPAHTHTDWVGSNGAGNPDSGGAFTVTGGPGTIALELDSGFATRLGQAAEQDFPAGMPGIPQLYWYHKADLWHEYDGEPGVTSGDPYSSPPEAVYCWRGWGWLLTRLNVPTDCTLTLMVTGKAYSFSDPHCTGSARQTDFEHTGSAFTHTYSQAVTAGDQYVYWCVANPTTEALVDLEVVESVTLSGLAAGNWTLYEPKLVLDPNEAVTEHAVIKAFEAPCQGGDENHAGGGYRKGGFSAHVDAAFYKALFWGDEQNANVAEKTGGMFDLILSANYEIDTTTAFSLSGLCDLITNCCDAWTCGTNSAYTSATTDSDSNTIPTWAFDVVPLEQSVDAGKASCSFRCGTWSIARGLVCKLVTDKYIGGALHGLAHDGATLKRSGAYADVYRRYPIGGTWTIADDDVAAQATGHWHSDNLTEVYEYDGDTPHYYRYGACLTTGTAPSSDVARAPVRETVAWLAGQVAAGGRRIAMFRHPAGNVQCWAWISGEEIKFNRLVSGTGTAGTPVVVDDSGAYDSLDAETDGAYIYVVARRSSDHGVDLFTSYDDGATWSSATDVTGD